MTASAPWRVAGVGLAAFAGLVLIFLVLPTLVIVPMSFSSATFLSFPPPGFSLQWYEAFANSPDYRIAILNSIKIGIPAAFLATVFGTLAALALVRGSLPGKRLLSSMMLAPLILPQIVLAIGLYPVMVRLGIIGSYPAILLGHTVVCMPLVFITVAASLRSYAPTYELAAMTLGAKPWATFRFITFPMIRAGVVLGFIFAFTFSFDELILAIFLTSPATRTVPRLLWEHLNYQMTPVIAAATVVLLVITLSLLVAAALVNRFGPRKAGAPAR
ncbi:ABC transporter permease [Rhodoligotrophos defluvii]|uniref:ABC transporter permease n=1 Tax=Rhodoligotrophos defluvii TaxID=2561934 RepID=UPI0010C99DD0|nr:ABC transporter permease [Rhodoligotrophos defluvii]